MVIFLLLPFSALEGRMAAAKHDDLELTQVLSQVAVYCSEHGVSDSSIFTHLCYFDEISLAALASHRLWSLAMAHILQMRKYDLSVCYKEYDNAFYPPPACLQLLKCDTQELLSKILPPGLKVNFAKCAMLLACFPAERYFYYTNDVFPLVMIINNSEQCDHCFLSLQSVCKSHGKGPVFCEKTKEAQLSMFIPATGCFFHAKFPRFRLMLRTHTR